MGYLGSNLDIWSREIFNYSAWHSVNNIRPYEWGNLEYTNPDWFKYWIQVNSFDNQLAVGQPEADVAHPGTGIWYSYGQGSIASFYIHTKAQHKELCDGFGTVNGCVGLQQTNSEPYWLIPHNPRPNN